MTMRGIGVALVCLLLAGCFDLEQKMSLNRDGSGVYEVALTAEGAIGEALKNEVLISESEGEIERQTTIVQGRTVHSERIRFRSLSDVALGDEDVSLRVHGGDFFGLLPKHATFRRVVRSGDVRSKSADDKDDREALAAVFGNHTYTFSVSLPGSIARIHPVSLGRVTIQPEVKGDYFRHTVTWRMPLHMMFSEDEVVFAVDFSAYGTFRDAHSRPKREGTRRS
ncbi:MAG: hypothetical protein ACT4OG_06230 [Alphaproteobacteria bacterium]